MRALNIRGLNITIPHKVKVLPLLDEIDPQARTIGAVNTVVNNKGLLKGYNTDAEGFMRALKECGIEVKGRTAVILGAGGAARAVCFALASEGAALIILNRTLHSGLELAGDIARAAGHPAEALALNASNLATALEKGHIICQHHQRGNVA